LPAAFASEYRALVDLPASRQRVFPDWTGPDDLTIKIEDLREITDWEKRRWPHGRGLLASGFESARCLLRPGSF
jgi:hypothetical protein